MNQNTIKNVLFNIAALGLGFAAITYLPISSAEVFGAMVMAGIGLIAVKDYTPRRQLNFVTTPAKQVAPRIIVRRRVSALVAA